MNEYKILKTLDAPWKLGLWELDIALSFSVCVFLGLMRGTTISLFVGAVVGILIARLISKIKAARHPRYFKHLLYWMTPSAFSRSDFPPSDQQEMVG